MFSLLFSGYKDLLLSFCGWLYFELYVNNTYKSRSVFFLHFIRRFEPFILFSLIKPLMVFSHFILHNLLFADSIIELVEILLSASVVDFSFNWIDDIAFAWRCHIFN